MFRHIPANFSIGGSTSIQDLFEDGYKSVFIGTGAWKPRKLHIPGETFGHVFYAINYLNNPDVYDLGDDVVIVGAGNAAMDVARTAIRHGSKNVTVYVRGDEVNAAKNEFDYAQLDGVRFEYNKAIVRITDDGAVFCDMEKQEDGSFVVLEDTAKDQQKAFLSAVVPPHAPRIALRLRYCRRGHGHHNSF